MDDDELEKNIAEQLNNIAADPLPVYQLRRISKLIKNQGEKLAKHAIRNRSAINS